MTWLEIISALLGVALIIFYALVVCYAGALVLALISVNLCI